MASINWTADWTYSAEGTYKTLGTITTGSKKCSSITCLIPMGTGNATFTAGTTLTGTGDAISTTCTLGSVAATNTVTNKVGASSYSGGTYPTRSDMVNYTWKFTGSFAANTTYTLQVSTPATSAGGTGLVLCVGESGTYSYVEVEDNIIITFNKNGGTSLSEYSRKVESGSAIGTMPTGSYPITITYSPNGGSVNPTSATKERPISKWNTKSDGSGTNVTSSSKFTSNTTVYAIWGAATLGDLPTPTRTDCKYRRWTTTKNGNTAVNKTTTATSNTTIYADWTYKLTYNGNGGKPCQEYTGRSGNNIYEYKNYGNNALSDVQFAKYDDDDMVISSTSTFNANADGSGTAYKSLASIVISAPLTIYAQYGTTSFTVKFEDGYSGKVLKSQTVGYGGNATPPSAPTRSGYTFSGWLGDYINVKKDTTVQALWSGAFIWYRENGKWVEYKPSSN